MGNEDYIEASLERIFDDLLDDLRQAFPHPFEWICLLERPPWWRLRARRAHNRVRWVFLEHGFLLTDAAARAFYAAPGQMAWEDAGGCLVRQLRQAFQGQAGVAFHDPRLLVAGGRAHV